ADIYSEPQNSIISSLPGSVIKNFQIKLATIDVNNSSGVMTSSYEVEKGRTVTPIYKFFYVGSSSGPFPMMISTGAISEGNPDLSKVTFESDDPSIASIDSNGVITGNEEGSARITIKWKNIDSILTKYSFTATVTAAPEPTVTPTPE